MATRGRFDPEAGVQVRTYEAQPRPTYEAVRATANGMGYRILSGGAAQGLLEAISPVFQGDGNRSSRQIALSVRLHPNLDGTGTEVRVRFTEINEADSSNRPGMATEIPLKDTPQYEAFFRRVRQTLEGPDER